MSKKILVTGSAGFIGFHLCNELLKQGNKVVGVDNYSNYYSVKLKKARTRILKKSRNFKEYKLDISNFKKLRNVFLAEKFDCVVNLAAQAGVRYSLVNPFVYEEANLRGFVNILECCKEFKVKNFVYASSSSVYGGNKKYPFSEKDCVDNPISLYAATKKSNELIANVYHHLFGINCCGLRFFTVYGPWGRPDMALFIFVDLIKQGKEIPVFNKGKMYRDFTYVGDIIKGVISAINNNKGCEVYNLGRGECRKLIEFINEIEKNLGKKAKMKLMGMQAGDVPKTSADISKARKNLNYNPKTSIKEGIKKFVEWHDDYFGK